MAHERNPNDPYRSADDPYRSNLTDDDIRRQARLDSELQPDPDLGDPTSGGKVAMYAIAIAVVLGAIFYGLNNSTINQAGTSSTAQNTQQSSPPAAPPGMRDVTPRGANTEPGTTTGAAPARPQMPPAPAPADSDVNKSASPPADNQPAKK